MPKPADPAWSRGPPNNRLIRLTRPNNPQRRIRLILRTQLQPIQKLRAHALSPSRTARAIAPRRIAVAAGLSVQVPESQQETQPAGVVVDIDHAGNLLHEQFPQGAPT